MNQSIKLKRLILIEMNEINFELVEKYVKNHKGKFLGIEKLLNCTKIITNSENKSEELEPWIQWASVHTGKSYSDHRLFRLGDIVKSKIPQIFEELEKTGVSVGVISSMGVDNRLIKSAYFIPDPWTQTSPDNSWWSKALSLHISQAVRDNSKSKITIRAILVILIGLIRFAKINHYFIYLNLAVKSLFFSWQRALLLDLFLHDIHTYLLKYKKPGFSTLFLNAGAHIQHHYFYNSPYIYSKSNIRNPEWYILNKIDPIFEMIKIYNRIIEDYLADKEYELIVATGLSQCACDKLEFYYRLRDHFSFLQKIGINFLNVYPKMSRDFTINFKSEADAKLAQIILGEIKIIGKIEPLFGVIENRATELFITLTYSNEILVGDMIKVGLKKYKIYKDVVFVAVKNGKHISKGYAFCSIGLKKIFPKNGSHVKELYTMVSKFFKTN